MLTRRWELGKWRNNFLHDKVVVVMHTCLMQFDGQQSYLILCFFCGNSFEFIGKIYFWQIEVIQTQIWTSKTVTFWVKLAYIFNQTFRTSRRSHPEQRRSFCLQFYFQNFSTNKMKVLTSILNPTIYFTLVTGYVCWRYVPFTHTVVTLVSDENIYAAFETYSFLF